jgi:dolichol kinase
MAQQTQISYSGEVARKGIHFASLLIPIIYLQIQHRTALSILAAMTTVSIVIDILMHRNGVTRRVMMKVVGPILRDHERQEDHIHLTGASWVLIAALLTFAVFPREIAVTAFTVLIVSDTCAALIGRRFGRRRFFDKSVAGTIAFVVSAIGVVLVYASIYTLPSSYIIAGILGSIVAGPVEAASVRLKLDDNISIPFSMGLIMWAAALVMSVAFTSLPSFLGSMP